MCVWVVFGPCFVIQTLQSFLVLQHLAEDERVGLFCSCCHLTVSVLCVFYRGTLGCYLACDCGISWSNSLAVCIYILPGEMLCFLFLAIITTTQVAA